MEKIKVLFICHGNICRSTMAQYVFQDLIDRHDLNDQFYIDSAATSREEIGNPVPIMAPAKDERGWNSGSSTQGGSDEKNGNMTGNMII